MATEVKAPDVFNNHGKFSIFLAGTIEQGTSWDWQKYTKKELENIDVVLFNPRRDNWNSDLPQTIDNPDFLEQVTWEQNNLKNADYVIFVFLKNTYSPISLLEFGQCVDKTDSNLHMAVCCDPEFYRRGNIEIMCDLHKVELFNNIRDLVSHVKKIAKEHSNE